MLVEVSTPLSRLKDVDYIPGRIFPCHDKHSISTARPPENLPNWITDQWGSGHLPSMARMLLGIHEDCVNVFHSEGSRLAGRVFDEVFAHGMLSALTASLVETCRLGDQQHAS